MSTGSIYEFRVPEKIIFGLNSLERIGKEAKGFGNKAMIVTGRSSMRKSGILDKVKKLLRAEGIQVLIFDQVEPEPSVETVDRGTELARKENCDMVIGLGGGSALDVAKAVAGMVNLEGSVRDYQLGKEIDRPGIPFIGIPTTSGTGSEITSNSVLIDPKRKIKQSVRSWHWLAKVAIVDPILTLSCPPDLTAAVGMDALTQAIETYVSKRASPVTDALAIDAINRIGRGIRRAVANGEDIEARAEMAYGSLITGMAFSNAGLGAVHALAHPIGVLFGVPHGVACALLLPYVMEYNLPSREEKFAQIAKALGEKAPEDMPPKEAAELSVRAVRKIQKDINIPQKLSQVGVRDGEFGRIVQDCAQVASLKTNPREASPAELMEILQKAL